MNEGCQQIILASFGESWPPSDAGSEWLSTTKSRMVGMYSG